jgi:hypothetical protein
VQIWPEYDQPSVLVIYDLQLTAETALPAQVSLSLPKSASILALAEQTPNGLLTVPGQQAVSGETQVITFTADKKTVYRLEYYLPFAQMGAVRTFDFVWPGDYAVNKMTVSLQEPIGASNLKTTPALSAPFVAQDEFVYRNASYTNLPVGQAYTLQVSYQKSDNSLSVSGSKVQPSQPIEQAEGRSTSLMDVLPWILGGLGIVLVVGGVAWYQLDRQHQGRAGSFQRKRHKQNEVKANEPVYCPQCGKRATGQDRFCRACGGKLRREE